MEIKKRKDDHIRLCLERDVRASYNHWDDVILKHRAIPSSDLDEMDTSTSLLGKDLDYPIVIAAMTGGSPMAMKFNEMMARAASEFRIGMGVGSQRAGIEDPSYRKSYEVIKDHDIPLVLGNLGAPQFSRRVKGRRYGSAEVDSAMEMIDADAICIHLNYLQEIVQPEGDTHVNGFLDILDDITSSHTIIAKETGAGISREDAELLRDKGISGFDVGGLSGTTFSGVESYRYDPSGRAKRIGSTFWDWGIPTPLSIMAVDVDLPIIGTGGLRDGIDLARSVAVGADAGGFAWKLLKAASNGYDHLENELRIITEELKGAMFLTGSSNIESLGNVDNILTGKTAEMRSLYVK